MVQNQYETKSPYKYRNILQDRSRSLCLSFNYDIRNSQSVGKGSDLKTNFILNDIFI